MVYRVMVRAFSGKDLTDRAYIVGYLNSVYETEEAALEAKKGVMSAINNDLGLELLPVQSNATHTIYIGSELLKNSMIFFTVAAGHSKAKETE